MKEKMVRVLCPNGIHISPAGVMAKLLNEVYEVRFLDCSYGFREKLSAHEVVRFINQAIMTKKVNYVLEADIKGFFDNVNHDWLM